MTTMSMASSSCCCSKYISILPGSPSQFLRAFSSFPSYLTSAPPFSHLSAISLRSKNLDRSLPLKDAPSNRLLCRAAEYVFPDPIPEFTEAETNKFRAYLLERLTKKKKDLFGDSIEEVVGVCAEILSNFLHTEYGGPGTLLVLPFIDMADTLNERGLPGGPQAARAAVVWAQKNVDNDWNQWTKGEGNDDLK